MSPIDKAADRAVEIFAIGIAGVDYCELCDQYGVGPIQFENEILSIDRKFLPACALAVLADRAAVTVEYYRFLAEQLVISCQESGEVQP